MPNAARINDHHTCPAYTGITAHVGGPITQGSADVHVNKQPAARQGDQALCTGTGAPDPIAKGSATVFINGKPAARMGDMTSHGGVITMGSPNVQIGG